MTAWLQPSDDASRQALARNLREYRPTKRKRNADADAAAATVEAAPASASSQPRALRPLPHRALPAPSGALPTPSGSLPSRQSSSSLSSVPESLDESEGVRHRELSLREGGIRDHDHSNDHATDDGRQHEGRQSEHVERAVGEPFPDAAATDALDVDQFRSLAQSAEDFDVYPFPQPTSAEVNAWWQAACQAAQISPHEPAALPPSSMGFLPLGDAEPLDPMLSAGWALPPTIAPPTLGRDLAELRQHAAWNLCTDQTMDAVEQALRNYGCTMPESRWVGGILRELVLAPRLPANGGGDQAVADFWQPVFAVAEGQPQSCELALDCLNDALQSFQRQSVQLQHCLNLLRHHRLDTHGDGNVSVKNARWQKLDQAAAMYSMHTRVDGQPPSPTNDVARVKARYLDDWRPLFEVVSRIGPGLLLFCHDRPSVFTCSIRQDARIGRLVAQLGEALPIVLPGIYGDLPEANARAARILQMGLARFCPPVGTEPHSRLWCLLQAQWS